jgi:uncharacterized protein with von Willebrand factor type A (vWA) domain
MPVGTGRIVTFCRAAAVLDALDPEDIRLAARATLVSRPSDLAALDESFDRYFRTERGMGRETEEDGGPTTEAAAAAPGAGTGKDQPLPSASRWASAGPDEELEGESAIRVVASDVEVLRTKDFANLTDEERRAAFVLVRRLALSVPERRSRRYRPAPGGPRFDVRKTLRRSLKTEGEPFRPAWRSRGTSRRPLVLILDVSGSMAPYTRPLVEFAHAATLAGRKVEAFVFGTRLTRVTRALRARDPGGALQAVAGLVTDWEGGTRIGESLKEMLDVWASRSALRGGVVVLCSDGLERGDPQMLSRQMARLSRLAHRVVWVNPLKGSPRYEPLARGMAASLPHVDVFLPGHNLESLEALSETVSLDRDGRYADMGRR